MQINFGGTIYMKKHRHSSSTYKQKMQIGLIIVGGLLLIGALFFLIRFLIESHSPSNVLTEQYGPIETVNNHIESTESLGTTESSESSTEEYISPVDFETLQSINPDIYAWIEIPGTTISYPIVQHPTDDSFYLRHNTDGEYSSSGSIFTEGRYNSKDFSDPITLIYGHHTSSDNMFGPLQAYFSDDSFLTNNPTIVIYTPDTEYVYSVFAALPYNNSHILYSHDMNDPEQYQAFFDEVMNTRELGAFLDTSKAPQNTDTNVVILSTCLDGNSQRRFLVMGSLVPNQ